MRLVVYGLFGMRRKQDAIVLTFLVQSLNQSPIQKLMDLNSYLI